MAPTPETLTDGPLQGLRVMELGQLLAGPFVGTLLGDFGADALKIEAPPGGDPMRDWAACATTATHCGGPSSAATSAR